MTFALPAELSLSLSTSFLTPTLPSLSLSHREAFQTRLDYLALMAYWLRDLGQALASTVPWIRITEANMVTSYAHAFHAGLPLIYFQVFSYIFPAWPASFCRRNALVLFGASPELMGESRGIVTPTVLHTGCFLRHN